MSRRRKWIELPPGTIMHRPGGYEAWVLIIGPGAYLHWTQLVEGGVRLTRYALDNPSEVSPEWEILL